MSETLIVSNMHSYSETRIEVNLKQLAINRQKNTRTYFMNTNVMNQHERELFVLMYLCRIPEF